MKPSKLSFGVGAAVVVVASLVALSSTSVLAQGNPFLGTWVLNVAKSTYSPGPSPKDQTVVYEVAGQGMKATAKGRTRPGNRLWLYLLPPSTAKTMR